MATRELKREPVVVIPRKRTNSWAKVADFFGTVGALFSVYFGSQANISRLDPKYRDTLTTKEKALIDADNNGLWTQ